MSRPQELGRYDEYDDDYIRSTVAPPYQNGYYCVGRGDQFNDIHNQPWNRDVVVRERRRPIGDDPVETVTYSTENFSTPESTQRIVIREYVPPPQPIIIRQPTLPAQKIHVGREEFRDYSVNESGDDERRSRRSHKKHLAEGALLGAGAGALIADRSKKEGEEVHRGRSIIGGAALGAIGTEI